MKVNCACCRNETIDGEAEMIYLGMGSCQYICPKCQKLPFEVVMARAEEDDSPRYIGGELEDDVLRGKSKFEIPSKFDDPDFYSSVLRQINRYVKTPDMGDHEKVEAIIDYLSEEGLI